MKMLVAEVVKHAVVTALQERPKRINRRRMSFAAHILTRRMIHGFMLVSFDLRIGRMTVRVERRIKIDVLSNEFFQVLFVGSSDYRSLDAARSFDGTRNRCFANRAATRIQS